MFKQTMWRVYRRTRKDEDYANYKEALILATTEIRKCGNIISEGFQMAEVLNEYFSSVFIT